MGDKIPLDNTVGGQVWGVWFVRVVEKGVISLWQAAIKLQFLVVVSDLMFHDSSARLWWHC